MKILSPEKFAALSARANNWDAIVAAVTEANPEFDAANASPETIAQALAGDDDAVDPNAQALVEANSTIETLNGTVSTHLATIQSLTEQVTALKAKPAESTAGAAGAAGAPAGDPNAEVRSSLVEFAAENAGDHNAIIEHLQETGFLPK